MVLILIIPRSKCQLTIRQSSTNLAPGSFSKIQFSWRDAERVLTVSDRRGSFPGMDLEKNLCIVFVSEGHGVGVARARCDKEVVYSGQALQIVESLALFA